MWGKCMQINECTTILIEKITKARLPWFIGIAIKSGKPEQARIFISQIQKVCLLASHEELLQVTNKWNFPKRHIFRPTYKERK